MKTERWRDRTEGQRDREGWRDRGRDGETGTVGGWWTVVRRDKKGRGT